MSFENIKSTRIFSNIFETAAANSNLVDSEIQGYYINRSISFLRRTRKLAMIDWATNIVDGDNIQQSH